MAEPHPKSGSSQIHVSYSKVIVYEKPTRPKCREVKRVLTAKGIEFESVDYIEKNCLSANELRHLLHRAGLRPQDALSTNEAAYKQHVMNRNLSDEQLVRVMAEHPELIQRPIVVRGNRAVLARPAEKLPNLVSRKRPRIPGSQLREGWSFFL